MGQPNHLQADPSTSLGHDTDPMYMGFETLSSIIQNSVQQFIILPEEVLRMVSIGVMFDIAEKGWEFHHDDWPGFTHDREE